MSTAIDVLDIESSPPIEPVTKSDGKIAVKRQYESLRRRMQATPPHIRQIANEELARKDLLHGDVTDIILTRDDTATITSLTKRYGCSEADLQIVIDYFVLVRMMSSDQIGAGTYLL